MTQKSTEANGLAFPKPTPRKKAKAQADRQKQQARRQFIEQVMGRDGYHCLKCGSTKNLTVHEPIKRAQKSYGWSPSELDLAMTLCFTCHMKAEKGFYGPHGYTSPIDFQISILMGLPSILRASTFSRVWKHLKRMKDRQAWRESVLAMEGRND